MNLRPVLEQCRYLLLDAGGTRISDYDLVMAANVGLASLSYQMGQTRNPLLAKKVTLGSAGSTATSVDLPADLQEIVSVSTTGELTPGGATTAPETGKYGVMGLKLYVRELPVTLVYVAALPVVQGVDDEIPLPDGFSSGIRDLVLSAQKRDMNALATVAARLARWTSSASASSLDRGVFQ